ncbi:MAG: DUF2911 domain-containing protein [Chitinophagales bacterium]
MKKVFTTTLLLCLCLATQNLWSQSTVTNQPKASQKAIVGQTIGLTEVLVTYHRPAVKERELWGKLVPYGAVWRAGANDNTIISFSTDVSIEGKELKAGTYGLHIIPNENGMSEVIFSKNISAWGSYSYTPDEDALRVNIQSTDAPHYEFVTFLFEDITATSANCALVWGKKKFPFKVEVDVHNIVFASLKDELQNRSGWTWMGWNEAANYALQNDVNHKQGLAWATRSVFMTPNSANLVTKARLSAKVKNAKDKKETMDIVTASLEQDLATFNVGWQEYHGAANYLIRQKSGEKKALEWLDKSIEMKPNMSNMLTKSNLLTTMDKGEEAEKVKADAISRGTNSELNNYGYQLLFGGKLKEAVDIFAANTKKNPSDANAWDSLGEGYAKLGDKKQAIKSFKKALSLNPPANVKANSIKVLKELGVDYKDVLKP